MLSMGFARELNAILETLPKNRQGLFFSATIPPDIERLAHTHLREHRAHHAVERPGRRARDRALRLRDCSAGDKIGQLVRILEVEDPESAIIFCNTRDETQRVAEALKSRGFDADWLNGDLPQNDRERVMSATREGRLRFLVATDVAARGIDISHLTHVINHDFPETAEQYVHRTGRTGRAGRTGHGHLDRRAEGHRQPLPAAAHLQDPPHREAAPERRRAEDARRDGPAAALRRRVREPPGPPRRPVARAARCSRTTTPSGSWRACCAITWARAAATSRRGRRGAARAQPAPEPRRAPRTSDKADARRDDRGGAEAPSRRTGEQRSRAARVPTRLRRDARGRAQRPPVASYTRWQPPASGRRQADPRRRQAASPCPASPSRASRAPPERRTTERPRDRSAPLARRRPSSRRLRAIVRQRRKARGRAPGATCRSSWPTRASRPTTGRHPRARPDELHQREERGFRSRGRGALRAGHRRPHRGRRAGARPAADAA